MKLIFKILMLALVVAASALFLTSGDPVGYLGIGVGAMLTSDLITPRRSMQEPQYDDFGLAANTRVFLGSLAEITATGMIQPAGTTGGTFCVFVTEYGDNRGGADGDLEVKCEFGLGTGYLFKFTGNPLTRADLGKAVYAVDDQTVSLDGSSGTRSYVGKLVHFESATEGWVSVEGSERGKTA